MVEDYLRRKTLRKIGGTFEMDKLTTFETEYLCFLESECQKLEQKEIEAQRKKK